MDHFTTHVSMKTKRLWRFYRRRLIENQLLISCRKINKLEKWHKQAPLKRQTWQREREMNKVTRQKRVTRLAALAFHVFDQSQDTPVQSKVMNIQSEGNMVAPQWRGKFCDSRYIFNLVPWSRFTLFVVLTLPGIVEHCESSASLLSLKCHHLLT